MEGPSKHKTAFQLISQLMNPTLINYAGHYEIDKIEGTASKRPDDEKYLISVCLMFGITLPLVEDTFDNVNQQFLFMQMLLDNYNYLLDGKVGKQCFPKTKIVIHKPKSDNDRSVITTGFPLENISICQKIVDKSGFDSKWYKSKPLEAADLGMHISFCTGMHYFYSYGANLSKAGKEKMFATGKEKSQEGALLKRSILNDGDQIDKALHKLISHDRLKIKN